MATAKEIEKYRAFLEDELNSVALYQAIAENKQNTRLADVYQRLAATEQGTLTSGRKNLKLLEW